MNVLFTPTSIKQSTAMPKADAERMQAALRQVAIAHPRRLGFVTELLGEAGVWRLRKGDWRAVYFIGDGGLVVVRVEKRGEVYR